MNSRIIRFSVLGIVISLLLMTLINSLIIGDTINGASEDRYREADEANEDSLFVLWENGTLADIELNADLRMAVISTGLLLFISIFSTLMMHFSGRQEIDE